MVEVGNFWYFFFIFFTAGSFVGMYYLLKGRSPKTQRWVLGGLLIANLALHFLKILFEPYAGTDKGAAEIGFTTFCSVSICFFPFFFFSKSDYSKDFMFYFGFLSGLSAVFVPTEPTSFEYGAMSFFVWRFYLQHIIVALVPTLMVVLGMHKLNYRRVWKMPFYVLVYCCFIMVNQVLQVELGLVPERFLTGLLDKYPDYAAQNFFEYRYRNPSLIWGPDNEYGGISKLVTILTPDFMKTVPYGEYKGQPMYWPLFYLFPTIFVVLWIMPFLMSMPWEYKRFKGDCVRIVGKVKSIIAKYRANDDVPTTAEITPTVESTEESDSVSALQNDEGTPNDA